MGLNGLSRPFWLKCSCFSFEIASGRKLRMHAQSVEEPSPETDLFTPTLWLVFGVGVLLGVKVTLLVLRWHCWWCGELEVAKTTWTPQEDLYPPGWSSIVVRALRFIRKRRRVSLAFNNYKNKPLRHSPSDPKGWDQPSQGWLKRAGPGGGNILREGPAIRDGSIRR